MIGCSTCRLPPSRVAQVDRHLKLFGLAPPASLIQHEDGGAYSCRADTTALLCASVLLAEVVLGATSLSWPYGDRCGVSCGWQWRKGRATAFASMGWVERPLGCKTACHRMLPPHR